MTTPTTHATRPPFLMRLMLSIPVVGWIARDLIFGDKDTIWYFLVTLLCLWVVSIMTWGLPALYLPAVASVPVVFGLLLLITRG